MKRILLGALCAVTTLALLTGCVKTTAAPGGSSSAGASGSAPGSASAGASGSAPGSASGPITTLPDPDAKPIPAQLTAEWSEDAVSETWDTAPANPGDGAAAVTFTADSTVRKFEILSLTTDIAQDGTASYTLGDPLYAVSELPQGAPITASLVFMGILPDLAVRYQDTDGTERCCTLTVSGEDGALLLTDITAELN